ncbi:MAG: hypothetical protein WDA04_06200 [Anaerolineaceae bacterium]
MSSLILILAEGGKPPPYGWALVEPLSSLILILAEGDDPPPYG